MREVRMTFGEHLEDLRKRIIFCLLYLLVAVSITFTYGDRLLKWTLEPHYDAISRAHRSRLTKRMASSAAKLDQLTSMEPVDLPSGERLLQGPIEPADWAVLFAEEVALPQIAGRLKQPFDAFAAKMEVAAASMPEKERAALSQEVRALGEQLGKAIVEDLAPSLGTPEVRNLPRGFRELRAEIAALGGGTLEDLIGWSKSAGAIVEPLDRLLRFLDLRREEVLKSPISLDSLRQRALEAELPRALAALHDSLRSDAKEIRENKRPSLMAIDYTENFMAYLKVSMIFGIALAMPFILYELWKFIGAGLYPHEQKYVVTLLPFSILLFVAGGIFGFFVMIPLGLGFLAGWGLEEVELSFRLQSYVSLFLTLILILGLVFQTPLIMVFLAKIGVVDARKLRKVRRMAIFVGVCLSVVLTPPDPVSWSLMAVPMILLYEVGILACSLMERTRPKEASLA